ncbi:hypothetical protein TcWFU_003979 [Taenia crassiceps]|uniref:Uncharacterized protein n=1 Tax=Taenia crassiceps TaxID=6207 RepID=A0ABR4QG95_9CEST
MNLRSADTEKQLLGLEDRSQFAVSRSTNLSFKLIANDEPTTRTKLTRRRLTSPQDVCTIEPRQMRFFATLKHRLQAKAGNLNKQVKKDEEKTFAKFSILYAAVG